MKEPQLPTTITPPDYLGTLSDVLRFIVSVETLMETPYNSKDGNAVADRIADLVMLFPSSTKAIASVTFYRDELLKHTYSEMMKKATQNDDEAIRAFKQASVITAIAKSRVAELNALLVYVERVNASITHSIDGMRSILSNLKEERRMMAGASYNT